MFCPVTPFAFSFWRREAKQKGDHSKDHSQHGIKMKQTRFFTSNPFLPLALTHHSWMHTCPRLQAKDTKPISPWCSDLGNSDELNISSLALHCTWADHSFSSCFAGTLSPPRFFLAEAAVGSSKRQENEPAVRQNRERSWQSSRKSRLMAGCVEDSPHSLCYCHI